MAVLSLERVFMVLDNILSVIGALFRLCLISYILFAVYQIVKGN